MGSTTLSGDITEGSIRKLGATVSWSTTTSGSLENTVAHDLARRIHRAHAALFQRQVDPGIIVRGCSALMLGADQLGPRFSHHPSEGQAPNQPLPLEAHYGI